MTTASETRTARDAAIVAGEAAISETAWPLMRAIRDGARARGDQAMTVLDRAVILNDVDKALDAVYGRFPGDPEAWLTDEIAAQCAGARQTAITMVADLAWRRLARVPSLQRAAAADRG
jgi:hypothetical protein